MTGLTIPNNVISFFICAGTVEIVFHYYNRGDTPDLRSIPQDNYGGKWKRRLRLVSETYCWFTLICCFKTSTSDYQSPNTIGFSILIRSRRHTDSSDVTWWRPRHDENGREKFAGEEHLQMRNDTTWPRKVKGVYDNLLSDLYLKANSVPLLAGEVVNADQGGTCASMNKIIASLPQTIPQAHVFSSPGWPDGCRQPAFYCWRL